MIIIVEGVDRVGKTTLIKRLQKATNFPVYNHAGERDFNLIKNDVETDMYLQILEVCKLSQADLIFDRFCWSDFVYGCIERHYDFTKALCNKDAVEKVLRELQAVVIFVKPTNIVKSSTQHGRDLQRHEQLFEFLYKETCLEKIECTYDTMFKVEDFIREKVNFYMKSK